MRPESRQLHFVLGYLSIDMLIHTIVEPYRTVCYKMLDENRELFERARGSTHNHQTWDGGYIDHVTDVMNYARVLYTVQQALGRPLPFTVSDALLVLWLHDTEKPWRIIVDESGEARNREGLNTKELYQKFREQKFREYGLELTPDHENALRYVEGEGNDYKSTERVMNPLAAFCHQCDVWSARQCFDYPKESGKDEWIGAKRYRTIKQEGTS